MATRDNIVELYVGYFNRAPDPEGLNYWFGEIEEGTMTLAEIAESFSVQPEAVELYPFLKFPEIVSPAAFVTQVYLNLFNREPDDAGLDYWVGELEGDMPVGEAIVNIISGAQDTDAGLDATTLANKVEAGFNWTTSVAGVQGFNYFTSDEDGNLVAVPANEAAAQDVIADVDDTAESVEAAADKTDAFVEVLQGGDGEVPSGGQTLALSVGADMEVGGSGNDTFIARVAQNDDGEQANQLGTGDLLIGSGGIDTLEAVIQKASALNASPASAIAMETSSVEIMEFTALSEENGFAGTTVEGELEKPEVAVNMKFTDSVDEIASSYSDADLIVYNVNTLTESGEYEDRRNTDELTIRMDHTAGFTAQDDNEPTIFADDDEFVEDPADFTVLIDQDYLISGQASEGQADFYLLDQDAELRLLQAGQTAEGRLDIIDRSGITFTVEGETYTIQFAPSYLDEDNVDEVNSHEEFFQRLEDVLADTEETGARLQLREELNDILPGAGDAAIDALPPEGLVQLVFNDTNPGNFPYDAPIPDPERPGEFLNLTALDDGTQSRLIPAFTVETINGEEIEAEGFTIPPGTSGDFNVYGRSDESAFTQDLPITVDVDLIKAGRGQDGGELTIGSMDTDGTNTLSSGSSTGTLVAPNGVEVFNVTVYGDETQNSSLAELRSTNNVLTEINVDNAAGSRAALIIGNSNTVSEGGIKDVLTVNASSFANAFWLDAVLTDEIVAKYMDRTDDDIDADADDANFSYIFGLGDDILDLDMSQANMEASGTSNREDFSMQIDMGNGGDAVFLDVGTVSPDEDGSPTNINWYVNHVRDANDEFSGRNDDNNNQTDQENGVDVDLGNGDDFIEVENSSAVTIDAGAGADVVFTDNNEEKATWVLNSLNTQVSDLLSDDETSINSIANLHLRVTFQGIESEFIDVNDSVGSLTGVTLTDLDIVQAVKEAINTSGQLSPIVVAQDGPGRTLVVDSLVDGEHSAEDFVIELFNSGALTQAQQAAPAAQLFVTGSGTAEAIGFQRSNGDAVVDDRFDSTFGTDVFDNDLTGLDSNELNHNTVEGGEGADVMVLSTQASVTSATAPTAPAFGSTETVDIDGVFGTDTILNFKAAGLDAGPGFYSVLTDSYATGPADVGFDIFDVSDILGGQAQLLYQGLNNGQTGAQDLGTGIDYSQRTVIIADRVNEDPAKSDIVEITEIANAADTAGSGNTDQLLITVNADNTGTFWYLDNGAGVQDVSVTRLGTVELGQYVDADKNLIGSWEDMTLDNFVARTQAELVDLILT